MDEEVNYNNNNLPLDQEDNNVYDDNIEYLDNDVNEFDEKLPQKKFGEDEYKQKFDKTGRYNKNHYKEEGEKLKQRQNDAKEARRSAYSEQQNENKRKDSSKPIKSDGSNTVKKDKKDKKEDALKLKKANSELKSANKNLLNNKINSAKSMAYAAKNPTSALGIILKNNIKRVALSFLMSPVGILMMAGLGLIIFIMIFIIVIGNNNASSNNYTDADYSYYNTSSNNLWWPIAGDEISEKNGNKYSFGEPLSSKITSPYGPRILNGVQGVHTGIDIDVFGDITDPYIVASASGTVVVAVNSASNTGYGSYIKIEHDNNKYTLYAHLKYNSITVNVGDTVSAGEIIGIMGETGNSFGVHLHFEVFDGGSAGSYRVNPSDYVSLNSTRPTFNFNSGGSYNAFEPMLSKTEFLTKMDEYADKISNPTSRENYKNNFLPHGTELYNAAIKYKISPEFLIAKASIEAGSFKPCGSYNFFGYAIPNTQSTCPDVMFGSMTEAVEKVAGTMHNYINIDSSAYKAISSRIDSYKNSNCNPAGYGPNGSLEWIMSHYAWFGTYLVDGYNTKWGKGGCIFIKSWVNSGFMPEKYTEEYYSQRCPGNYHCDSAAGGGNCKETTTCERSDYNAFTVKSRLDKWNLFIS